MYAGSPDLMNYPMNETPLFPSYNEADTGQYDILMQEVNHEDQEEMNQQDTTADEFDISHLIDPALLAEGAQETLNIAIAQSAEEALNILNTNHFLEENLDPQLRNFQSTQMTASSLVSPPDSTNNDREDNITTTSTTTATIKNLTPPPTATDSSSSRHPSSSSSPSTPPPPPPSSSRLSKALTISTPKSNTSPQRNLSSNPGDTISNRDSTSPMINLLPLTTTTVATTTMTGSSKGSTTIITTKSRASSEIEADEASLKLIREMQAQDLGLRRRA